jgi:hypothetical protein
MNATCIIPKHLRFALAIILPAFAVGCASQTTSGPAASFDRFDIEGKWLWEQDPWHGYFVLEKDGDSYSGTLDDTFEGTYEDEISDVSIRGDNIKFTRYGRYGIQYWQGTLKREDGVLKIVDGRWKKKFADEAGTFHAEKRD